MAGGSAKNFFKYGCFGCAGLFLLAIVLLAVVGGTAFVQQQGAQVETRRLEQDLHEARPADAAAREPGHVTLELGHGEIHVEPAESGEPLHVDATYDIRSYELVETREESATGGFGYRLSFRQLRAFNLAALFGGRTPKVRVFLPRDVPFALDATFERGPIDVELGGLWLTRTKLKFRQGALILAVSEPLAAPAESFEIDGKMGALVARKLGNSSARKLVVHHEMGGLVADLSGHWLNDAEVEVTLSMGGGELRLPKDVTIRGLDSQFSRFNVGPAPELPRPILDMNLHFEMGNLEVSD